MDEIQRMTSNDYLPTDADILNLGSAIPANSGIQEREVALGSLSLRILHVNSANSARKKWIHHFENVTSIIFFLDISEYDRAVLEPWNQNAIMDSLIFLAR